MIITITGKPCSGKSTVAKLFSDKYGFKHLSTGDLFRTYAKEYGYDILSFQQLDPRVKQIDDLVDKKILNLGIQQLYDDIIVDSRLAWHFIPKSFKVFIDVSDVVAGNRLISANRETEKTTDLKQSIKNLKERWKNENNRYQELYNINNFNLDNYNLVINSDNLSPEKIVEIIYEHYLKYINN